MNEKDFDDFDPTQLTCGDCAYWIKVNKEEKEKTATPTEIYGHCYGRPPAVFPAQQPNMLGQMQLGFINVRPVLPSTEYACGLFEDREEPQLNS